MEFETSDEQEGDGSQFSNSSKGKASMIMQAIGKMDEMPIAMKESQNDKTKGKEIVYSSTIEKSKKQPYEAVKIRVKLEEEEEKCSHEEKKTLQNLIQNLERMFNEQNKYVTTLRGEHDYQIFKQRWTPEGCDA